MALIAQGLLFDTLFPRQSDQPLYRVELSHALPSQFGNPSATLPRPTHP